MISFSGATTGGKRNHRGLAALRRAATVANLPPLLQLVKYRNLPVMSLADDVTKATSVTSPRCSRLDDFGSAFTPILCSARVQYEMRESPRGVALSFLTSASSSSLSSPPLSCAATLARRAAARGGCGGSKAAALSAASTCPHRACSPAVLSTATASGCTPPPDAEEPAGSLRNAILAVSAEPMLPRASQTAGWMDMA